MREGPFRRRAILATYTCEEVWLADDRKTRRGCRRRQNPRHDLASSLYQELHRLAVGKMRFERGNHTLATERPGK